MGERKVLNKYYPPDFDPAKIPRKKQPKNMQMKVRMMLPMSIRCSTCGSYISKGTKFNCRKEDVLEETYLGILIFRFYFKCTTCSAELVMKTDPQNSDYTMESGASRNFEPWRATDEAVDAAQKKRDKEEMGDSMKSLENRTLDSKREMDIMAALDEMKSMRARQAHVDTDDMLNALKKTAGKDEITLAAEDEALIKSLVFKNSTGFVRRLDDEDGDGDGDGDRGQGLGGELGWTGSSAAKRPKVSDMDGEGKGAGQWTGHKGSIMRAPPDKVPSQMEVSDKPPDLSTLGFDPPASKPSTKPPPSAQVKPPPAFVARARPVVIAYKPKSKPNASSAASSRQGQQKPLPNPNPNITSSVNGNSTEPKAEDAPQGAPVGLASLAAAYDDSDDSS